jgi:hypothetical protein
MSPLAYQTIGEALIPNMHSRPAGVVPCSIAVL